LSRFAPNFVDRGGVFILNFGSEIEIARPEGQGIPDMITGHLVLSLIKMKRRAKGFFDLHHFGNFNE